MPSRIRRRCWKLRVRPIECVYVGDDLRDVQAGRAAGMRTVAATYGYLGSTDVKEWGADVHIETPLALLALLKFRQVA